MTSPTLDDVLDSLEQLNDLNDQIEKHQELLDRITELRNGQMPGDEPPDPSVYARILEEIMDCVVDDVPIPDGPKKVLKHVVHWIGTTVDLPIGVKKKELCRKYIRMRTQRFDPVTGEPLDHDQAADAVTTDPLTKAWLALKWLERQKLGEEPEQPETPEADDGTDDEPTIYVPAGPPWASKHNECCSGGQPPGKDILPDIDISRPVWGPEIPGPQRQATIKVKATHPCGFRRLSIKVWTGRTPTIRLSPRFPHDDVHVEREKETSDGVREATVTVLVAVKVRIKVSAVSNCYTANSDEEIFSVPIN